MPRGAVTAGKRVPLVPVQGDAAKLAAAVEAALPRMTPRARRWFQKLVDARRVSRPASKAG